MEGERTALWREAKSPKGLSEQGSQNRRHAVEEVRAARSSSLIDVLLITLIKANIWGQSRLP